MRTERVAGEIDLPDLLDLVAAGEYLHGTEWLMRRLVQERRIAYLKVGRRVLFSRQDLDAFLESNRTEAQR